MAIEHDEVLAPGDLPSYDTKTELALKAILATVMTNLVAVVPFLGFPLISSFTSYVAEKTIRIGWGPLVMFGAFQIIDADARAKAEAYQQTVNNLEDVLKNPQATESEIKEAHEQFKIRLGNLIRIKPIS